MPNAPGSGRPRKPAALHILHASRNNAARLNPHEPGYAPKLASPPKHLSKAAAAIWRSLGKLLLGQRVITEADHVAFAMVCATAARVVEYEAKIAEYGAVIILKSGDLGISPYSRLLHREEAMFSGLASRFGLTPADRTRIVAAPPEAEADPMEVLLRHG